MAITTVDGLIASAKQYLAFNKLIPSVGVANTPHSVWAGGGLPVAGGYGSVGKANGRVLTSATAGAMPYGNVANQVMSAFGCMAGAATCTGTLYIVDIVSSVLLAHAETTGSITGVTATSRLPASGANAEGCQIWLHVQTVLSAGSNTWTLGYTNQNGTASRTTGNIVTVASAVVNRNPMAGTLWAPLQSGDSGVRSIDSITLAAGSATGQIEVALVRVLGYIPMSLASVAVERDFAVEIPALPTIYDSSCLSFILVPTGAAAASTNMIGSVRLAAG